MESKVSKVKKEDFDLCLLDVMMPYKDGFTLAREIREKNETVPLIFLTAKTMKEDVLKALKSGQMITCQNHLILKFYWQK